MTRPRPRAKRRRAFYLPRNRSESTQDDPEAQIASFVVRAPYRTKLERKPGENPFLRTRNQILTVLPDCHEIALGWRRRRFDRVGKCWGLSAESRVDGLNYNEQIVRTAITLLSRNAEKHVKQREKTRFDMQREVSWVN